MPGYIPFAPSQADGYKLSHKGFEQPGTTHLVANFTPRSGKYIPMTDDLKRVISFGYQDFVTNVLVNEWNETFFTVPFKKAIGRWKKRVEAYLGPDALDLSHFEALHKLGYLPLHIKALPEGSKSPFKVALMTVRNTHEDFAWLVTYIETVLSQEVWPMVTAATVGYQFLTLFNRFADETVGNRLHVPFQGHDFSARGMAGRYAAARSGAAHLLSFLGTDTIAALDFIEQVYPGYPEATLIGTSVPASEHSVTSLGIAVLGEEGTIRDWITRAYPTGIVSIVSDTIDYWKVLLEILPALKEEIRARKPNALGLPGKVVVRPDSGDPVRIVCGYRDDEVFRFPDQRPGMEGETRIFVRAAQPRDEYEITEAEFKGSIQVLWEEFGGTTNALGYKELDPCIGLIYGDGITLKRAEEILSRLQQKGFASNNIVFGMGSFTYQMTSRDTLGMAVKATYAIVNGEGLEIYKDPKTDDGTKKSARGLIYVGKTPEGHFYQEDQVSPEREAEGELRCIFEDGKLFNTEDFVTIRNRVQDIVPAEEATA